MSERLETDRGSFRIVNASQLTEELGVNFGLSFQYETNITGIKYEICGNGQRAFAVKVDKWNAIEGCSYGN